MKDAEGFQVSRQDKRRMLREKRKRDAVVSKRQHSSLRGGHKYADIFVFRVHRDVDGEEVKSFIKDEDIPVMDFRIISNREARMKSYKVTIRNHDYEKVMDVNFWPDGIACRRYISPRIQK